MTHLDELNAYLERNGIKQVYLCNILGWKKAQVSNYLNGKSAFGKKAAQQWSDALGLSYSWLLTGEGPMLKEQQGSVSNTHIVGNNNAVGNNNNVTIAKEDKKETTTEGTLKFIVPKYLAQQPNTDVYSVVMSGEVTGLATLKALPPYSDFDFYYQVRQDAMQPNYMQGDVLALAHLEADSDIIQGAAMVVDTTDYGFLLRRLYDRGDYYECRTINKESAYESQDIKKSKVIRLYKVVYSVRLGD